MIYWYQRKQFTSTETEVGVKINFIKGEILMKKTKILANVLATAMLAGSLGIGAFAAQADVPKGLESLGERYGFSVEQNGELEGLPVYEVHGIENFEEILKLENSKGEGRAKACDHVWHYYWVAKRENCYKNPNNQHTLKRKMQECLECGKIMNNGETVITNCPSGCSRR